MAEAPPLRWEWTLANGARVAAEIEPKKNHELVFVGTSKVADAKRGARPEGHSVVARGKPGSADEAISAVVTFEPNAPICILRVDGFEVAPSMWPAPRKRGGGAPVSAAGPWRLVGAAAVIVLLGVVGYVAWS